MEVPAFGKGLAFAHQIESLAQFCFTVEEAADDRDVVDGVDDAVQPD